MSDAAPSPPEETTAEAKPPAAPQGGDRRQAIADLETELRRTPRASSPYEHATLSYRLGLAYAEAPLGDPAQGLRKALGCYEVAAGIFDAKMDPVEHARVLNAAGAAHRGLGDARRAAALFEQASSLFEGRDREDERAATLNNLGLSRAELGQIEGAIAACDAAIEAFDPDTAEGRRGLVATLHTRGMAKAAPGTREALLRAIDDYQEAAEEVDVEEAPYHFALVHHSLGVTSTTLAGSEGDGDSRRRRLTDAVAAYTQALAVFTRTDFRPQHAMTKHNLGLALVALDDGDDLRRALTCFEDAAAAFDQQVQGAAWTQSYASLTRVEAELATRFGDRTRSQHFTALVAASDEREAITLLRDRLPRLLDLPASIARGAFTDLALAVASLDQEGARTFLARMLSVMMELPQEHLATVLGAVLEVHGRLGPEQLEVATVALDQAVSDALVGPQRIWVRDYLYSMGFERP